MNHDLKSLALLAIGLVWTAQPIQAQTLTINGGTPCSYTQYLKTVNSSGVANFAFTASGCSSGGGSTPNLGTVQFSASTFNSALAGTTRDVTIQRDGHIPTVGGNISGSVVVATASAGNCSIASPNFTYADGDTAAKTITVSATAAGTCSLEFSMNTGTASGRITSAFNVTPSNAIAFAAGSSSTIPSQSITLPVNRTDAGAAADTSVSYTCTLSGFTDNSAQSGVLNFQGNSTRNVSVTVPALATTTNGTITCSLSNATPNGTIVNSPTRSAPEHVVTVTPPVAPTCSPTAAPAQFIAGNATNVTLNNGCTANVTTGTTFTWSRAPSNTTGPDVTSGNAAQSGANFLASAVAGSYVYRLVACNGTACTGNLDVTVTANAAAPSNCYQFDAPDPGVVNNYTILVAKDRTSSMRLAKNRLNNFTWYSFDSYAVMQVSDQPCAPAMLDPIQTPIDEQVFRPTCQFSIVGSYQSIILNGSKCNVPAVADGGFYYINIRPVVVNGAGTNLSLTTPTASNICQATLPGGGGAACQYTLGF